MSIFEKVFGIMAILIMVLLVVGLVYSLMLGIASAKLEKKCLLYGWKDYSVTWDFQKYCIREENEYEIVKPLEEIINTK